MKKNSSFVIFLLLLLAQTTSAQDTLQQIMPNRINSEVSQQKPYVILISADGFRHDLADIYKAKNLLRLSKEGVRATAMQPVFPSLTFPNHYSIITGMYPAHNGLVGNSYYNRERKDIYKMSNKRMVRDGSRYGGIPLWVLAEKNKMIAASFFWVGSEADIANSRPTYFFNYNETFEFDRRLQILKEWLQLPENKRPHFISFYFPEVDHEAHRHGVNSKEAEAAVHYVDASIGKIDSMCRTLNLPINFIFVSDHGMANTDTANTIPMPKAIDPAKFIIPSGDAVVMLYAKNKDDIKSTYKALKKEAAGNYKVYTRKCMPKRFKYNLKNDTYNRIGDIILLAAPPRAFNFGGGKTIGRHGYDNKLPDMQASFMAWGPAFKTNYTIGNFSNVNVYPLIAEILKLPIDFKIDGKLKVLKDILKENK